MPLFLTTLKFCSTE